jgi:formate C-acetyltransferase
MKEGTKAMAGRVKVDNERVQRLRKQFLETPLTLDNERLKFMKEVYDETAGYQNIIRRAKFLAHVLEHKTLYIDENLFVGSMASSVNAVYTYPEWQVEWMKQDKTVEKAKDPEERELMQWVVDYWDKRALRPRSDEIFIKKYGYDPNVAINAGLYMDFNSWPAGGGNLNYPLIYQTGVAAVIKDIEERQAALDMYLANAPKLYFYEACLIVLRAVIKFANRYAALARDMAAKETNPERKQDLLDIAEVCEHVPEHPARNLREAIQAHFFSHLISELEQAGCGYSEGYLGQMLDPYLQRDKAAGTIGAAEATYMLKHLFIKLNEINYYYGQAIGTVNSADLGQTITLGGYTGDASDATAEMDFLILDAAIDMKLPQPPLTCMYHDKLSGKFLEKCLDMVDTATGMPQFVNGDVAVARALNLFGGNIDLEKARRPAVGACVGTYIPYETGHPLEGQPNLGKALELTMNDGKDFATGVQVGPKTGDPETFKDFEALYAAFQKQLDFMQETLRHHSFIGNILCAEFIPCAWRSILTKGCIERGLEVWNGGANYNTVAHISVGGVDAANGLMAVKHLVFDEKKLTMAELKKALAANFEGEYEKIGKLCYEAPKYGNDSGEPEAMAHRVYESNYSAFQKVGGLYLDPKYKAAPDAYTKSVHNYFGLKTWALPTGKKKGVALTDGSMSAMPGTDTHGATALVASASKGIDAVKYTSSHMNMKLPPTTLKTRKGRETLLNLIKTGMDLGVGHIQFSLLDTKIMRDAQLHPEKYADLVVRVAGFSAFFTRLHEGVQDEIIARTEQTLGVQ